MLNSTEIFHQIDHLIGSTRRFDVSEVTGDLARFLHRNRDGIDVDRLAKSYIDAYDRSKRPKTCRQLSLFDPAAWIPCGRNQRVIMRFATLKDLREWEGIETAEHVPSVVACNRKVSYIRSRASAWDVTKYKTLGELEAAEFSTVER